MQRALLILLMLVFSTFGKTALAQQPAYGQAYRLTAISTQPARFDGLLADWKRNFMPRFEALKKQGQIEDYQVFFSVAPSQWDLLLSVRYDDYEMLETLKELDREMALAYGDDGWEAGRPAPSEAAVTSRVIRHVALGDSAGTRRAPR